MVKELNIGLVFSGRYRVHCGIAGEYICVLIAYTAAYTSLCHCDSDKQKKHCRLTSRLAQQAQDVESMLV